MKKKLSLLVLAAILSVSATFLASKLGAVKLFDEITTDAFIKYFSPKTTTSEEIVLVLLDEETMQSLPYRSPVPRDFLAKLNDRIFASGPKAIGYDIYFKDPSFPISDEKLMSSLAKSNAVAVSAGRISNNGETFEEDAPLDEFARVLKSYGLSDLPVGSMDTVVRYAQVSFVSKNGDAQSFVAKLYEAATQKNAGAVLNDAANKLKIFGISFLPYKKTLTNNEQLRIRYNGPAAKIGDENAPFKMFPASLVADGTIPSEWLNGKIVLVGAAYNDATDTFITPYFGSRYNFERMPGVLIQANVLNQLLTGEFFYFMPAWLVVTKIFGTALIACALFMWGSHLRGALSLAALVVLIFFGFAFYFNRFAIVPEVVLFLATTIFAYLFSQIIRSVTEGRQKKFIKSVFQRYVPAQVVEKMVGNPKLLKLGGEARVVTSMFTDIASFTTISENLSPENLVEFLNDYLDRLTRVIFKHGGTLDKYEGDAIIAFFGAPIEQPNHCAAAISAAIEMQKESNAVSRKWQQLLGREVETRIGLNTGKVVVGNMGSMLRFDYTAIGDAINLAARLEGANKFFGTKILSGETVIGLLPAVEKERFVFRKVCKLKVKGKKEPTTVFEIAGFKEDFSISEIEEIVARPSPDEIIELSSK